MRENADVALPYTFFLTRYREISEILQIQMSHRTALVSPRVVSESTSKSSTPKSSSKSTSTKSSSTGYFNISIETDASQSRSVDPEVLFAGSPHKEESVATFLNDSLLPSSPECEDGPLLSHTEKGLWPKRKATSTPPHSFQDGIKTQQRVKSASNVIFRDPKLQPLDFAVSALVDKIMPKPSNESPWISSESTYTTSTTSVHSSDYCDNTDLIDLEHVPETFEEFFRAQSSSSVHKSQHSITDVPPCLKRTLTKPETVHEVRRMKNKASAARTRMRKLFRVQALEMAVVRLEARVDELQRENEELKRGVWVYR